MTDRYLLDTSVMLLLIRGGEPGLAIEQRFGLRTTTVRPFVSIVTRAELQVLARRNGWGPAKLAALATALANVVTINIRSGSLLEAYVAMELASRQHRPSARTLSHHDLCIAATAKVARATLLTTDNDFAHLSPNHCRVVLVDSKAPRSRNDAAVSRAL